VSTYFFGKRVLITGASSGIGLALSQQLAKRGAKLVLIARNKDKLTQAVGTLNSHHEIEYYSLDLCDQNQVEARLERILRSPVDLLINNAGIASNNHFEQLDEPCFREMMETNFFAQVAICRQILAAMKTRKQGHIVHIASMAGVLGIAGYTAYGSSKFALVGFARALRNELAGTAIRTTLILPADVDTPQLHTENQSRTKANKAVTGAGSKPLSSEGAAAKILQAIEKQKQEAIISAFSGHMLFFLCQLFPKISYWVMDSMASKHQK